MDAPIVQKQIPAQIINEGAAYGPFNLRDYLQTPDDSELRFSAELTNQQGLPKGLICTADGLLTGIPGKNTQGNYEVVVTAENAAGSVQVKFPLIIKPTLLKTGGEYFDKLKTQVWQALEQNMPIPDLGALMDRPITIVDIYYMLERWGILTIWDAFNVEAPGDKIPLNLEGASPHYHVYDRGNCLVATPKDLYSHERTLLDGIMTAQAMAREVYKRNWTVELIGFDKLARAAWVEIQHLGDQYGKRLEIINYRPSSEDVKIYSNQSIEKIIRNQPE